jgi:hypothetical protein
MAPSLSDEVAAAFDALVDQRKADAASLAAWRAHSVDVGSLPSPPVLSTSPTAAASGNSDLEASLRAKDAELAKLRAHAMDLQQRNEKLEADAEERASAQEGGVDLPGMPGSSAALPSNSNENAEANYAKLHELEILVAEQMSVIQQLTSEKKDLTVRDCCSGVSLFTRLNPSMHFVRSFVNSCSGAKLHTFCR